MIRTLIVRWRLWRGHRRVAKELGIKVREVKLELDALAHARGRDGW
jgi:hypothetical protein